MSETKIQLSFKCSKDWNDMTPVEKGRFCNDCQKTVFDYTKMSLEKILEERKTCLIPNPCGQYTIYQVEKPFDNWRDQLVSLKYQLDLKWKKIPFFNLATWTIFSFLLIMTGCRSNRVRGVAAYSKNESSKNKQEKVVVKEKI